MIGEIYNPEFEGWKGSTASFACGDYPKGPTSTNILNFVSGGAISDDYCKRWYDYVRAGNEERFPPPPPWKSLPVPPGDNGATTDLSNYWKQITAGSVDRANVVEQQFMSNIADTNAEHDKAKNPVDYIQLLSYVVIIGLGLVIVKKI